MDLIVLKGICLDYTTCDQAAFKTQGALKASSYYRLNKDNIYFLVYDKYPFKLFIAILPAAILRYRTCPTARSSAVPAHGHLTCCPHGCCVCCVGSLSYFLTCSPACPLASLHENPAHLLVRPFVRPFARLPTCPLVCMTTRLFVCETETSRLLAQPPGCDSTCPQRACSPVVCSPVRSCTYLLVCLAARSSTGPLARSPARSLACLFVRLCISLCSHLHVH